MVRKEAVKNLYSNSSEMKNVINSYLNNSRYLTINLGLPTFVRTLKPYVYFESIGIFKQLDRFTNEYVL